MAVNDFGKQEKKDRHLPQIANMFSTKIMECVLLHYVYILSFIYKSTKMIKIFFSIFQSDSDQCKLMLIVEIMTGMLLI